MKTILFFLAMEALFLISCSDDKFDANSEPELKFDIFCEEVKYWNVPYIHAFADISVRDDAEYYYYYWIIDGERFYRLDEEKKTSYGEHLLEFVLIDRFGDTLGESCVVRINEPLKVNLLSPIEKYEAAKTDAIVFQYKISGIDTWEENLQTETYISTDKKVWKQIDGLLMPPLTEKVYYWRVKAFTEQDTTFSEIRSVWIKD